jgi:hypothetical protein
MDLRSSNVPYDIYLESLEKEKKVLATNPHRTKSPNATFNKNNAVKFGALMMGKSNYKLNGLFANPPNPAIPSKFYEGELVVENL